MQAVTQVLLKPTSGKCNLKCKYCFYSDVSNNREIQDYGDLSIENLEIIVKKVFDNTKKIAVFAFQGGEPTLCGLDFYKIFIKLIEKYNTKNIEVKFAIQTNGILIDENWAEFFKKNNFLVGLSLDGTKHVNDKYRLDFKGEGTFDIVVNTAFMLKKHNVEFNILTVVTKTVTENIEEIYNFFKDNNFTFQQYIIVIEPFNIQRGFLDYSVNPIEFQVFLIKLFDLWINDIKNGIYIYNRFFENIYGMIKGYEPESCNMIGKCTVQNVIEADGSVFPCDFYVLDNMKIGNILVDDFETIEKNSKKIEFVENSLSTNKKCMKCEYYKFCRGGCKRDRQQFINEPISLNYFCNSFYKFYEYAIPILKKLASL